MCKPKNIKEWFVIVQLYKIWLQKSVVGDLYMKKKLGRGVGAQQDLCMKAPIFRFNKIQHFSIDICIREKKSTFKDTQNSSS